jgi:soluble epoxide hydrolase/lipid-phosphate phosphatase
MELQYLASVGPYTPIEAFLTAFPRLTYQVYFRDMIDTVVAELEADIRRTIRVVYRHSDSAVPDGFLTSSTSFLTPYDGIEVC